MRHEIIEREQSFARIGLRIFPQFPHHGFVVLADAGEHDPALLQAQQRLVQAEIKPDKRKHAADRRLPREGRAGFSENAGPQGVVEIDDNAFLAAEPQRPHQHIDMRSGNYCFTAIGIAVNGLDQALHVGQQAIYRRILQLRPLQHPAG